MSFRTSETNNQEAGVDEADLIKVTKNGYIYTVSGNKLNIVRAYPIGYFTNPAYYASTTFHISFKPTAIFIEGSYLAVFGTRTTGGVVSTLIIIYNIQNNLTPVFSNFYEYQGDYFDGRKNGGTGYVYLVSHIPVSNFPWYKLNNGGTTYQLPLSDIRIYPPFDPTTPKVFINIVSFSLRVPHPSNFNMKSIVTEKVREIYMSYRSIYISYTDYINGLDYTRINKIYVWGSGIWPLYQRTILGTVHNQFAFDEYYNTGVLRVITTRYNSNTHNHRSISVYSLNFYFQILSQKHYICPYDRVTATRYYDKSLYVGTGNGSLFIVTFQPNHYFINVYNKVNLQGIPRYMHLLTSNYLLSFGKRSGNQGLKVWVYDVTAPWNPQQIGFFELTDQFANSIL